MTRSLLCRLNLNTNLLLFAAAHLRVGGSHTGDPLNFPTVLICRDQVDIYPRGDAMGEILPHRPFEAAISTPLDCVVEVIDAENALPHFAPLALQTGVDYS